MIDDRQRVQRIVTKLAHVRERGLSCFGSEKHGFRLNAPKTEAELCAFEDEQAICLPRDYRAFLLHGGDGGAGPYYGIYTLDQWSDLADWIVENRPADFLRRSCPLHPDIAPAPDWASRLDCDSPYQGTLSLGTQGCTFMMQLVVTGPFAGRVVYVDADGNPPYMVRERDFLSWYERWLDELLGGYKTDSFGYGPGGGEEDFFLILNDPDASDAYKSEAAAAFCRLPHLSDAASKRITSYLTHAIAGVRAGACGTVRQFQLREECETAGSLLNDPSPWVRRQAIWTVMDFDPGRWSKAVLQRLREDSDKDVAATALFALEKAGGIPKQELLHLIELSPLESLRGLAANKVEWEGRDLKVLIRMLSDSNPQVRFYATASAHNWAI